MKTELLRLATWVMTAYAFALGRSPSASAIITAPLRYPPPESCDADFPLIHHAMATPATKSTPNGDMAASATPITPSTTSYAVLMRPGHTTPVTAQVLNTPELLDLILSNLSLKDILFRAKLTCRGFRNMIHTSPSIEGILAMTKLLTPSLYATSRTRYSQTITANRNHPGGRLLYFDFEPRGLKQLVSSPSFRKLYLPAAEMKRAMWWLKVPGNDDFFMLGGGSLLELDVDGSVVTVAGLLELILEKERVRMAEHGLEITELDVWYE